MIQRITMHHPRHSQHRLSADFQTKRLTSQISSVILNKSERVFTLFHCFHISPACPANSNIKMQVSMEHSWNAVLLNIRRFMWQIYLSIRHVNRNIKIDILHLCTGSVSLCNISLVWSLPVDCNKSGRNTYV